MTRPTIVHQAQKLTGRCKKELDTMAVGCYSVTIN